MPLSMDALRRAEERIANIRRRETRARQREQFYDPTANWDYAIWQAMSTAGVQPQQMLRDARANQIVTQLAASIRMDDGARERRERAERQEQASGQISMSGISPLEYHRQQLRAQREGAAGDAAGAEPAADAGPDTSQYGGVSGWRRAAADNRAWQQAQAGSDPMNERPQDAPTTAQADAASQYQRWADEYVANSPDLAGWYAPGGPSVVDNADWNQAYRDIATYSPDGRLQDPPSVLQYWRNHSGTGNFPSFSGGRRAADGAARGVAQRLSPGPPRGDQQRGLGVPPGGFDIPVSAREAARRRTPFINQLIGG